ncbi:MAG: hypothetical protein H6746_05260 [Deltaproteobacteria bacterium]|nr:hypothetical protein [Deltaproteobacteria bacterium]
MVNIGPRVPRLAWLLAVSLALAGCESGAPVVEGGVCRVCGGGGGIATDKCLSVAILTCVEGTNCLSATGTCERDLTAGEACDFRPCAAGLSCDVDDVCNPPAALGKPCGVDAHCAAPGVCLRGAGDIATGSCGGVDGAAGAACEWAPRFGDGSTWFSNGFGSRGCGSGLVCQPAARPALSAAGLPDAPGLCRDALEPVCGYPGVCGPAGAGARGDPCLSDQACQSGRCAITPPPYAVAGTPGFACSDADDCFQGPWPGQCLGLEDIALNRPCGALQGDPEAPPCGPGLLCIDGFCRAEWSGFGEKCEPVYPAGADATPACPLGATCSGACQG